MSDLLGNFSKNAWEEKHAEKSHVYLWEQSLILKVAKQIIEVLERETYGGFWPVDGSH